jgi:CrcB protein
MIKLTLIAAGGALGSVLRYGVQGWVQRYTSENFPTGTLAVNVIGCTLIGLLTALFDGPALIREEYRIGLTVGLLGGFTTFSTFGIETFRLTSEGQWRYALLNVVLSCSLGFLAVGQGIRLGERWFGG